MEKLVFATNNAHKLSELRQIIGDRFELLSLGDIGCHDDIPETADTLEGNAILKARWVKDRYGYDCFADDTGLEVDALAGHDSKANMNKLLSMLDGEENRDARFRTVIALIKDGETHLFEGIVDGEITESPAGTDGFGYDPVFRPEGWKMTFAEATPDEKNAVSHRGRAVAKLIAYLNE